ncbi:MAG: hypothetical protein ACRD06_08545 [Terriglobia bacterium]
MNDETRAAKVSKRLKNWIPWYFLLYRCWYASLRFAFRPGWDAYPRLFVEMP